MAACSFCGRFGFALSCRGQKETLQVLKPTATLDCTPATRRVPNVLQFLLLCARIGQTYFNYYCTLHLELHHKKMLRVGIGNRVSLTHTFRVLIFKSWPPPVCPGSMTHPVAAVPKTARGDTRRTPTLLAARNAPRCPGGSRGHSPPGKAPASLKRHVHPTLRKDQAHDSACTRSHLVCGGTA